MAPEVQDEDDDGVALYCQKVDVYSAAMVMYYIVTGQPPFCRQKADSAAASAVRTVHA